MTEHIAAFKKFDEEKQVVFAEVYAPGVIDSQGDFMNAAEIEKMAWRFMAHGRVTKVDTNHDLLDNGSIVVESFTARAGDPDFIDGAWVVGVHIPDAEIWADVKKGDINGFSMYGGAVRKNRVVEIEIPDSGVIKGDTADAEHHSHGFTVRFSDKGEFLGGHTTEVNGHTHKITKGTATDEGQGHSHRFSYMEFLS